MGFPRQMDRSHRMPVGPNTYAGLDEADKKRLSPKYPVSYQVGRSAEGKEELLSVTWGPGLLPLADRRAPGPFDYSRIHDKTVTIRDTEPGKHITVPRRPAGGLPSDPKTGEPKVPWMLMEWKYKPQDKPLQSSMGETAVPRPPKPPEGPAAGLSGPRTTPG